MSMPNPPVRETQSVCCAPYEASAPLGWWQSDGAAPLFEAEAFCEAIRHIHKPFYIVKKGDSLGIARGGAVALGPQPGADGALPVVGWAPAAPIRYLGDAGFCADYGLKYPYLCGSMAHGITSVDILETLGRAGMLAFFGAAGLVPADVDRAIETVQWRLGEDTPYGFNLIHSPSESAVEEAVADLYVRRGVRLVEASAFLRLTAPLVRYRLHGIHCDPSGHVVTPNRVIAKVSRVELAEKFFAPPPERLLGQLVAAGHLTQEQAELASHVPVAQDITAEADSGGHTDNRPAIALLPTLCALRDRMQEEHGYPVPLRVGLGGGIATPASAAAAFAMGAAYIMTGTVNQACIESGTSGVVRAMLAEARQADVTMAPAADMFEMGVAVQVLKRGTMFPMRAAKLFELYRQCGGMEEIPAEERVKLEETVFQIPLDEVWRQTKAFFMERDPRQVERAEKDPKHRMALVFRWYLGQAVHWATRGEPSRKMDYQVWCGPAMGAFNEWVRGTFLERPENRDVLTVALNLLHGAAVITRVNHLRGLGVALSPDVRRVTPLERARIEEYLK